jgi:hypothetical protein
VILEMSKEIKVSGDTWDVKVRVYSGNID